MVRVIVFLLGLGGAFTAYARPTVPDLTERAVEGGACPRDVVKDRAERIVKD